MGFSARRSLVLVSFSMLSISLVACSTNPFDARQHSSNLNLTGANGYPYCTNGSNTGGGYGWDTSVTDPKGSHSCLVPPATAAAASPTPTTSVATTSAATTSVATTNAMASTPSLYPYCTNGSNTGGGYGWDTSVTDAKGSHSCLVPAAGTSSSSSTATASSGALPALDLGVSGDAVYKISSYGSELQTNKAKLDAAIAANGANAQETALIIAIAMQETSYMRTSERDGSKDGTMSANCSILNVNYDMVTRLGYTGNDYCTSLNDDAHLSVAAGYLLKAFRTWGVQSTLNFQRGGSTAFQDGVSYGAADYRKAINTIYKQISLDQSLETDGRRVEIDVNHV